MSVQIGYSGTSNSLLASGIYGIVKVVATALFVFVLVDSLGRKLSLFISGMGMGIPSSPSARSSRRSPRPVREGVC